VKLRNLANYLPIGPTPGFSKTGFQNIHGLKQFHIWLRISLYNGFPLKGMGANDRFREWSCSVCRIPRFYWHRGIGSRGVNDTAESASPFSLRLRNIRSPRSDSAESELFKRLSRIAWLSHMRNGFSPLIRALERIVWWKKPRVEHLVTLSFKVS
jgi:hypothetical protein